MPTDAINTYPRNVVWFIEAMDVAGKTAQSGSGVAVWLKRTADSTPRKFLLTCAHVIRGSSAETPPVDGSGPILKKIQCYPHCSGYANPAPAVPAAWLPQTTTKDLPDDDRRAPKDWILLDVENPSFQDSVCAIDWAPLAVNCPCRIVGYPGGKAGFQNGIVANVVSDDKSQQTAPPAGCLTFFGTNTAPGMSGGGVFDGDGKLVGIHRSKADGVLQLGAVAVDHIRRELFLLGWEIVALPRDLVAAADETATHVSAAVTSLTQIARDQAPVVQALRGIAPTISRLEKDLDAMQAAKQAHETILHKLDFKIDAVKDVIEKAVKQPTLPNRAAALKQIGLIRNDAQQLVRIMQRCDRLYASGIDEATDFLSDVNDVDKQLDTQGADPYQPLQTFGIPRLERMAAQLQRSMTETASRLPFAELQSTIVGLQIPVPQDSPLEGLSKIGLLQDVVRRLVGEHDAWQKLHIEIPLLEAEVQKLSASIDTSFNSIAYAYKRMSKTVAALANQADVIEEVVELARHWSEIGAAIDHFSAPALTRAFVEFQNTATNLFHEADQRLLRACQRIASIGVSLRTLIDLL